MSGRHLKRECPRCWVPLQPKEERLSWFKGSVIIDECEKCQGIYLDDGELKKLTGNRSLAQWLTNYLGVDSDSKLVCPGCGGIMDIERPAGVEVEVCLSCKGLWLDAGELEQLAQQEPGQFKEENLTTEKLAEMFDAGQSAPTFGNSPLGLLGLFGRRRRR